MGSENRLIVLVPDGVAGNLELARKVYWMALRDSREVVYLALCDDESRMLSVTRDMATMKAITAANLLAVQSKLVKTGHWLAALREVYRPGDRIVCHEEQVVKVSFLKTTPIDEFLRDTFHTGPVILSGFYHPQQILARRWLRESVAWAGFVTILAVFTLLEAQSGQILHGLPGKVVLGGLFSVELGAVWVWNNLTGL